MTGIHLNDFNHTLSEVTLFKTENLYVELRILTRKTPSQRPSTQYNIS